MYQAYLLISVSLTQLVAHHDHVLPNCRVRVICRSSRPAGSLAVLPELVPKNEVRFFELRNFVLFPFFSAKKSVFPLFWGKMSVFPLFWSSSVFFDKKFLATLTSSASIDRRRFKKIWGFFGGGLLNYLDFCPQKPQKADFLGKNVGVYSNSVVVAV